VTRPLGDGRLPAVLAPVDGRGVRAALDALSPNAAAVLGGSGGPVVLDFGRTTEGCAAWDLLGVCDTVGVVTRGTIGGLGHTQLLTRRLRGHARRVSFILIDSGPYPAAEAQGALGVPCAGAVPFSPKHARLLQDPVTIATAASSPLAAAAGKALDELCARHETENA
jgi:hypothetical protein